MAEFFGAPNEKTWGIVLDKNNNSVVWPSELTDGDDMRLELSQATLGAGAKTGERNIVELKIISEDNSEETQTFPVVSLREGLSEHTLLNLTLNPPVSFKLVAGSGPISLMGVQHNVGGEETSDSDDDEDDQLVKPESSTSSKKRKRESPVSEAKKSKVEAEKTAPIIPKKGKADDPKQAAKDAIMKMMGGDDSDLDSNDEMDEFTPSDSNDDDDDDGKNGIDLGNESLSDESVEKVTKPDPVKKDKGQKATKPKPAAKSPETKAPAKSGKIQPQAMEAVKAKIRANKSLPKTEEKFKNYVKSLKVSDAGQMTELWKFVQHIRKP